MNTAKCQSTGYTAAYLTFGRELHTPIDVHHDLRQIVVSENFIPEITPALLLMADTLTKARESTESTQDRNREYTDPKRRADPGYEPGDKVMVTCHPLSKASKQFSAKLAPKRDGPYVILQKHGPTSYEVANPAHPTIPVGTYHTSMLTTYRGQPDEPLPEPEQQIRRRGRPRKIRA